MLVVPVDQVVGELEEGRRPSFSDRRREERKEGNGRDSFVRIGSVAKFPAFFVHRVVFLQ